MKIHMAFLRIFFVLLSVFFITSFMTTLPAGAMGTKIAIGLGVSTLFSALLFSLELLFKRYNLRAFNTAIIGLFVGYLMGQALVTIAGAIFTLTHMTTWLQPQTLALLNVCLYLVGTYLGCTLTLYFSDSLSISIPFMKLTNLRTKTKNLLVDPSALSDPRILDLAGTGLVDHMLVIPRFLIQELFTQAELGEEEACRRAKNCLDSLKKLEDLPHLDLQIDESPIESASTSSKKLLTLARITNSNILTADLSQVQIPHVEEVKFINLNSLSNALKPLMQSGETMAIKIQRYGKEPNQGVGYLEDGTMVVVNGGGDFIGECIDVSVLSVKHTSSGRMIFCNTFDDAPSKGNHVEV